MSETPTTPLDESDRNKRTAKRILAIFLPLCLVAGVGFGYAYWTTTGTGSGSAVTATTAGVTVTQVTAPANLAPGVPAGAISVRVTNPGTASSTVHVAQVVASFAASGAVTKATGAPVGPCAAGDYNLITPLMTTTVPSSTGGVDLTPGSSVIFTGASLGFNNDLSNPQNGCKGATVNLVYDAS